MGTLNLGEGTVACLQVRRERGFWGAGSEGQGEGEGPAQRGVVCRNG